MFACTKPAHRDEVPLWAWFLILPGLAIVITLIVRQMRYQAHLKKQWALPPQEFRLETGAVLTPGRLQPTAAEAPALIAQDTVGDTAKLAAERTDIEHPGAPDANQTAETADPANSAPERAEDDLTVIEGIGPKIEALLKTSGIHTYSNLADSSVEWLYQVLRAARLHMADPKTWPQQARLAAEQNWDALKAFQQRIRPNRPNRD